MYMSVVLFLVQFLIVYKKLYKNIIILNIVVGLIVLMCYLNKVLIFKNSYINILISFFFLIQTIVQ